MSTPNPYRYTTIRPGRYTVTRRSDEVTLGEVVRSDGMYADVIWTAIDVSDSEAWPFGTRQTAAESLDRYHEIALVRIDRRAEECLARVGPRWIRDGS